MLVTRRYQFIVPLMSFKRFGNMVKFCCSWSLTSDVMQPEAYGRLSLELAGDELTATQMCEAYSKAQGSSVSHFSPPKFLFWFLNRYILEQFLYQATHLYGDYFSYIIHPRSAYILT